MYFLIKFLFNFISAVFQLTIIKLKLKYKETQNY